MSTRAQVIIDDGYEQVWFYRHSEGYPEGVKETLDRFCEWVNTGRIRANASQSAGWLVMLGAKEYDTIYIGTGKNRKKRMAEFLTPAAERSCMGWKVGAYEPCGPLLHGDIEHLYVITLKIGCLDETGKATWKEVMFDAAKGTYEGQKK